MKKLLRPLGIAVLFVSFTFGLTNKADAKFWGKETRIVAYVGGEVCTYTDTYRFGIKVSTDVDCVQL